MYKVKILAVEPVTHDVKRFILEKPKSYKFTPGQATEVALNKKDWENKKHSFTFTSLNEDKTLEFIIKGYDPSIYKDHQGMTWELHKARQGDKLLLDNPWGTINYKGPGVFIAGGAGITPFIAIFRQLHKDNKLKGNQLLFSNKTSKDIILQKELSSIFKSADLTLTLTQEDNSKYEKGRVDDSFLHSHIKDYSTNFYICGPRPMVEELKKSLSSLGAKIDSVVFEE